MVSVAVVESKGVLAGQAPGVLGTRRMRRETQRSNSAEEFGDADIADLLARLHRLRASSDCLSDA